MVHLLVMNEPREDWSRRVELFIAALKLVETLVDRSSPSTLVLESTMARRSIAGALETIKTQSRTFLKLNKANGVTESDDWIYASVEKTVRSVTQAAEKRTSRPVKKQRRLGKEERYVTAMKGFVFGQAPIANKHAFANNKQKQG